MGIVLFEDRLGISSGYETIWHSLLNSNGLAGQEVIRRSTHRTFGKRMQLLITKGNRKSPGFNPDHGVQAALNEWVKTQLRQLRPDGCICMDPAILFMMNPDWDQATLDNLRGGVYRILDIPFIVSLPISAWHTQKKEKDIARMNEGFTDKDEWEEEHGGDETDGDITSVWIEPIVVPYGRFVLNRDLQKFKRILERGRNEK